MARSETEVMAVGSVAWLFDVSGSGVGDDTSTVLTRLPAALGATSTTTVICELSPTARPAARVHTTPAQVHPDPLTRARVMPAGSVSVTVTGPAAFDGPALDTVMVYVPSVPAVNGPVCDLVIDRSA